MHNVALCAYSPYYRQYCTSHYGQVSSSEYGILVAETSNDTEKFCILYFEEFSTLPETKSDAVFTPVVDRREQDFCNSSQKEPTIDGKIVLASDGSNCSLADKAYSAQIQGGKGLLVVTQPGNVRNDAVNSSALHGVNITVAFISSMSVKRLETFFPSVTVLMFSPKSFSFDFSLLIIWVMAVVTIAVGSFWSGLVRHSLHTYEVSKLPDMEETQMGGRTESSAEEKSSLQISPLWIGVAVLCMGVMLLLLYFFFSYLVYAIIALFVLASIISIYSCLGPIFKFLCCRSRLFDFQIHICCSFGILNVLRTVIAISLSVTWVVLRKESYSWILQDILGIAFSINMLKSIRLPSLKICTLLLVLLFFYDIFFVFITPFLTVKGDSVMVEVATGGNSQEQLPMVFRVPHFRLDPLRVCYQQYSLLGFGDILVPGLLVSFCHGMDLFLKTRRLYYITTAIAYGLGLILTFIGLHLMTTPQPALLYLVPATLVPTILASWARGELRIMWNGVKPGDQQSDASSADVVTAPSISDDHPEPANPPNTQSSFHRDNKSLLPTH